MNPVTTHLTLNLQLPNVATVSWAVQGDQLSRQIEATLVDGSTPWTPQTGYLGVVRCHKPDGTNCVYDVDEDGNPAVTWSDNVATIKIVQQALTVPGTVIMQLEFYDTNDARVSAFGWCNNVQPSAVSDTEFLSTDYYNILSLQIAAVLEAAADLAALETEIENKVLYYYQQAVSVASSAQIMRIPASGTDSKISTDTVVLECTFANPNNIESDITWTSYDGYIAFTGTCAQATSANVTLGTKGN